MQGTADYRALAIRYRPRRLSDLVGHEVVSTVLSNAISNGRVHHAFLFTGTRGVGKTTIARVIALSLNCSKGGSPTTDPCLECPNCKQIIDDSHPDVVEFDAASRTGVDAMREVIDSCSYPPIMARYKIYIIDEVHMLSKAAFNALLKTVEEPLGSLKFIFATTELRKVPITITSRCQRFVLQNLSKEEIVGNLRAVCAKEGCDVDDDALQVIARYANGSIRDSLSLLDQVIALGDGGKINFAGVTKVLSMPETNCILNLFDYVLSKDIKAALGAATEIALQTSDVEYTLSILLSFISALTKAIAADAPIEENGLIEVYEKHKAALDTPILLRMWQVVIDSMSDVRFMSAGDTLGMVCIKLIYLSNLPTPREIIDMMSAKVVDEDSSI